MTAKERLLSEEALVDLMLKHSFVPQKSAQNFNNMLAALREINPSAVYDPGCSGCMMDIAQQAKVFINRIKEESKLTFMTFPKHEIPTYTVIADEATDIKISITSDSPMPNFVVIEKPKRTMSPEHKEKIRLAKLNRKK